MILIYGWDGMVMAVVRTGRTHRNNKEDGMADRETVTGQDRGAQRLNKLSKAHWHGWYDAERRHSELLDFFLAQGVGAERAADLAAAELMAGGAVRP
jgi:hypothetical protein